MTHTFNNPTEQTPISLKSMADVLKMAGPQNWMLIGPDGKVWVGKEPMVLAAQASYEPFKFP